MCADVKMPAVLISAPDHIEFVLPMLWIDT